MLMMVFSDEDLFAIFIAEALFIRCTFINSLTFFRIFFKSLTTNRRFFFSSDGWFQLVSIGVVIKFVRDAIWL